jgi:hypothetical protein
MAKEEVKDKPDKDVVYLRELFGKGDQPYLSYPTLDKAIRDIDPKLKPEVYKAKIVLVGSLKWALIPVDGSCPIPQAEDAVSATIVPGKPVTKK